MFKHYFKIATHDQISEKNQECVWNKKLQSLQYWYVQIAHTYLQMPYKKRNRGENNNIKEHLMDQNLNI